MSTGSCFCGAIQIEFTGEPQGKISGSVFSTNILVPKDSFKTTKGKPKTITKKADSGKEITSYFCGDCGTTLYRLGDWNPTGVIIKAGVLDDVDHLTNGKPGVELFAPSRMPWISQVDGSAEKAAMP